MHTLTCSARRTWTAEEYHRMIELGILREAGVELVMGEVREQNAWGTPHRWTYEECERMVAGGIVDEDERLELVDGDLVCMTPVGHRHIYTVNLLTEYLAERARGRAILQVQSPLKFDSGRGLMPDLVLLRMHEDRYRSRPASASDALLVAEVSDSSLDRDLAKAELYARAAIPEYWIVDVNRPAVLVHRDPARGEYTEVREYRHGSALVSPALGGAEVQVHEVLGPP
ncbi:MAG TPA: Uma2 family endonuclease [Longimicrobium sp.]|jgi:Uma2 family endonuclease|uniref:Uma2 family endonuclease n=1 Tax=Longimicrobium sp. TaxID=2029185 RepID=UPI002ED9D4E4